MAVAEARNEVLVGTTCPVNTDRATCGHRACKAFTGASAALKSSLAGVAVVTRLRAPGLARSTASGGPYAAPAIARVSRSLKPATAEFSCARRALRKQPRVRRRARPRSKDRGPSFMANHTSYGAVACHPAVSTHPGRSIPNGEPCSPAGAAFPFASRRRTAMCASPAPRVLQAVGVLLGGSGRVRAQTLPPPRVAALLRPVAPALRAAA